MAQEVLDVCLWVLKQSNKSRFNSSVRQEQCIVQHPILPFGIVACTFFPTTFLEMTVYLACGSIQCFRNDNRKYIGSLLLGDRSFIEENAYWMHEQNDELTQECDEFICQM